MLGAIESTLQFCDTRRSALSIVDWYHTPLGGLPVEDFFSIRSLGSEARSNAALNQMSPLWKRLLSTRAPKEFQRDFRPVYRRELPCRYALKNIRTREEMPFLKLTDSRNKYASTVLSVGGGWHKTSEKYASLGPKIRLTPWASGLVGDAVGEISDSSYIAVHCRHSDYASDLPELVRKVSEVIKLTAMDTVLWCTDNGETTKFAREELRGAGRVIEVSRKRRLEGSRNLHYRRNLNGAPDFRVIDALADLKGLVGSAVFIPSGTRSKWTPLIQALRQDKARASQFFNLEIG